MFSSSSSSTTTTSNTTTSKRFKSFPVAGYTVSFPSSKKPFPAQLAVMSKVIRALHSSSNALIESPTGTGKTLALLSAALAFQSEHNRRKATSKPQTATATANPQPAAAAIAPKEKKKPKKPKAQIYFASRTHSQLSQVVECLKEADHHRPNVAILGSRKLYCVHERVSALPPTQQGDACRQLLKVKSCGFKNKATSLPSHVSRLCDIEELVTAGQEHRGCPYYAAQEMATT